MITNLQVLSESISKALQLTGGDEAVKTARFVNMMDKFFDALNVHNYTHEFQMPCTTSKDKRVKVKQRCEKRIDKCYTFHSG